MRFMMMYRPEDRKSAESGVPPSAEEMARMGKFMDESVRAGTLIYTEGLLPSSRGALARLSRGRLAVTDGPFAEAKEVVAGFAIVQAESKSAAVEIARQFMEVAGDGETEIRQLHETPALPPPR